MNINTRAARSFEDPVKMPLACLIVMKDPRIVGTQGHQ